MDTPALVDDRVAVIDEQLQLAVGLLVRTRTAQRRFPDRSTRDLARRPGSDFPRARPWRRSKAISFGGSRTSSPAWRARVAK